MMCNREDLSLSSLSPVHVHTCIQREKHTFVSSTLTISLAPPASLGVQRGRNPGAAVHHPLTVARVTQQGGRKLGGLIIGDDEYYLYVD